MPEKPFLNNLYIKTDRIYTPETSCMKRIAVDIKNMRIKQLCNQMIRSVCHGFPIADPFRDIRETGS